MAAGGDPPTQRDGFGQPFVHYLVRKLTEYLGEPAESPIRISLEVVRVLMPRHRMTFQHTSSRRGSTEPDLEAKLDRIKDVLEHQPGRTFAFDEFGPLEIRPPAGTGWAPKWH